MVARHTAKQRERTKRWRQRKYYQTKTDRKGVAMGEAEAALFSLTGGKARVLSPIARETMLRMATHVENLPLGFSLIFISDDINGVQTVVLDVDPKNRVAQAVDPESFGLCYNSEAKAWMQWWSWRDSPDYDRFYSFLAEKQKEIEDHVS